MVPSEEITEIKKILEKHEERITKLENFIQVKEEKPIKEIVVDREERMEELSSKVGITKERLRCVFDFDKDDLTLIVDIEGKNEGERQLKAAVCILTAYHYCYARDTVKSQDLRKKLQWLGIKSLANLSSNLSEYKQFIIPKGKSKSKDFSYKITLPGLKKGTEIIKELSGG